MHNALVFVSALAIGSILPAHQAVASLLSSVNQVQLENQLRRIKIEKVTGWYADMGQTQDTKTLEAASIMAAALTNQLGKGDRNWSPANPKWRRVHDQVTLDIHKELKSFPPLRKQNLEKPAIASFANALSMEDVDALTDFSRSRVGRRYWSLSSEIAKLIADTMTQVGSGEFLPLKTLPTQNELKTWMRILGASNNARLVQTIMEKDKANGTGSIDANGINMLWGMVFVAHSDAFRAFAVEYEGDLTAFDEFNESTLGKRQIEALANASMEMSASLNDILSSFEVKTSAHQKAWKQLYIAASAEAKDKTHRSPEPIAGGWLPVPSGDEKIKAVALKAVSLNAQETKTPVKLVAIKTAELQVVAGTNFRLTMNVLRQGKSESVDAIIWAKLDGTYELTRWVKQQKQ